MNACLLVQPRSTTILIDYILYFFQIHSSIHLPQSKARVEELLAARWYRSARHVGRSGRLD